MKTLIFISFIFILLLIMKNAIAKTEIQKYEVIYKKGNFEIRFYPMAKLASYSTEGSYNDSRNSAFRVLATYIFGGNKEKQQIAMTAPVRMSDKEGTSTMSFVLPAALDFETLPEPDDGRILLHQSQAVYSASIRYSGYTNDREIERKKKELQQILDELGLTYKNNFEYLGYNPPYQLVNRRNEVLVELDGFSIREFSEAKQN